MFDVGFADSPHAGMTHTNRTRRVFGHQDRAHVQSPRHLGVYEQVLKSESHPSLITTVPTSSPDHGQEGLAYASDQADVWFYRIMCPLEKKNASQDASVFKLRLTHFFFFFKPQRVVKSNSWTSMSQSPLSDCAVCVAQQFVTVIYLRSTAFVPGETLGEAWEPCPWCETGGQQTLHVQDPRKEYSVFPRFSNSFG